MQLVGVSLARGHEVLDVGVIGGVSSAVKDDLAIPAVVADWLGLRACIPRPQWKEAALESITCGRIGIKHRLEWRLAVTP